MSEINVYCYREMLEIYKLKNQVIKNRFNLRQFT